MNNRSGIPAFVPEGRTDLVLAVFHLAMEHSVPPSHTDKPPPSLTLPLPSACCSKAINDLPHRAHVTHATLIVDGRKGVFFGFHDIG
jgi:hypothetical protein